MSLGSFVFWAVAVSLAAFALGMWRQRRLAIASWDKPVAELGPPAPPPEPAPDPSSETLTRAVRALEAAVAEAEAWQKRYEGAFQAIEGIERQREEWKAMYYAAGRGHAGAQEMLFREIERLSVLAKTPVRPHLADLVQGYREEHALPEEKAEARVAAAAALPAKPG